MLPFPTVRLTCGLISRALVQNHFLATMSKPVISLMNGVACTSLRCSMRLAAKLLNVPFSRGRTRPLDARRVPSSDRDHSGRHARGACCPLLRSAEGQIESKRTIIMKIASFTDQNRSLPGRRRQLFPAPPRRPARHLPRSHFDPAQGRRSVLCRVHVALRPVRATCRARDASRRTRPDRDRRGRQRCYQRVRCRRGRAQDRARGIPPRRSGPKGARFRLFEADR